MELYQLSYFAEVVRQRSFTKAAAVLGIAQPALSQQMRNLEEELGAPLLVRSRRETTLTPAGATLLPQAQALLAMADAAKQTVAEVAELKRGRLVLASIPTLSASWLPDRIRRFRAKHPFIELAVREDSSEQVAALVERGQAELGFVQLPVDDARLAVTEIAVEAFLLVVAKEHPLAVARRRQIRLRDLAREQWIAYRGKVRAVMQDACRTAGFEPLIACETGELETVRQLVRAGLGIALLPELAVEGDSEGLHLLSIREPKLERTLAMVQRKPRPASAAARAFAELAP